MFWTKVKRVATAVATAVVVGGGAGVGFHQSLAQEKAAGPGAKGDTPRVTVLMTREWSPDGKVPTGTIWRGFQTWQTDLARTDKGELVPVDPMTPRAGRDDKGNVVRFYCDQPAYALRQKFASLEVYPARQVHGSAYPPTNWQSPDFDDRDWIRDPYPQRELYSLVAFRCLRGKFEVTDPGKVRDLELTVRFRGGAVAYVNGREVGRAFLPKGDIKPDTLAEDYPREAYVAPDGTLIEQGICLRAGDKRKIPGLAEDLRRELGQVIWGGDWKWHSTGVDSASPNYFVDKDPEVVRRYKSRCRTLEVKVPRALLRRGTNVLAVEIHRAPAWEGMFTSPSYYDGRKSLLSLNWIDAWWDRAMIEDVKLTAVPGSALTPNVAAPDGLRVWNFPADVDLDPSYYADPHEPLVPVRLRGLKNGTYSGSLVASSTDPIRGLDVRVTELKGPAGTIPASAVTVGYPQPADGFHANNTKGGGWMMFDTLEPSAPTEVARIRWSYGRTFPPMQPVWLTVRVPRNARAGLYRGTVTVNAEGVKPVTTSLEMEVIGDWVLPDPKDFITYVGFLECPDAVAAHYNVPLWSDEHWQHLDKVFEVLGQVGTKDLFVPLVARTHLGNPYSMVRWIRQPDGTYRCDTSIAERYIDTAIKHLGKIPVVCLFIAQYNQYSGPDPDQPICSEWDPKTGEWKDLLPPKWGTPEGLAFWKPVLDKLWKFLASRGLKDSITFGYIAQGFGPSAPGKGMPNYFADLWQLAPRTRWMVTTHVAPVSWRAGELKNVDILSSLSWMFALVNNVKWMDESDTVLWKPLYGWRDRRFPFLMLAASRSRSPTWDNDHCAGVNRLRIAAEAVLLSQTGGSTYQGFGSWGADFWGNEWYAIAGGTGNAGRTFANCGLSESTALWFVGPGKTGPVPTCRTRMMQEGLQEAEVRVFVQNALLDEDKQEKLGEDLLKRCRETCDERTREFSYLSNFRYNDGEGSMPRLRLIPDVAAWDDASVKLYRLADEVAGALAKP